MMARRPTNTRKHESVGAWIDRQAWPAAMKASAHEIVRSWETSNVNPWTGSRWKAWERDHGYGPDKVAKPTPTRGPITREDIQRSHVVTMTGKRGDMPRCRCGATPTPTRMDITAALVWTDIHVSEQVALVEPARFGFDHVSDKPTPVSRTVKPEPWRGYTRTSRSVEADVFYDEDGTVGYGLTFPSRRVLVKHLLDFATWHDRVRGDVLAYGIDHQGEFTCHVKRDVKGRRTVEIMPVPDYKAA